MTTSEEKPDAAIVNEWVQSLQKEYPDLSHPLKLSKEKECLATLASWRARVDKIRESYSEIDQEDLPGWIQSWKGGRQVIPCLLSIEEMTEEEREASHQLFVALSPKMADSALGYWRAHERDSESSVELRDLLGHLYQVFLIILSSFEPDRDHSSGHSGGFASAENRVRLVTWVHMASRYHINSYLQSAAYSVKPGSGHTHRLFQKVRSAERSFLARRGRLPSDRETAEEIGGASSEEPSEKEGRMPRPSSNSSGGGKESLQKRVREARQYRAPISLDAPAKSSSGEGESSGPDFTWGDSLRSSQSGSYSEIESIFDPARVIEERVAGSDVLRSAAKKLLGTGETLSPTEKYALRL